LHNKGSIVSDFLEGDKCHERWINFGVKRQAQSPEKDDAFHESGQ
jgi:hypothetical protein